MRLPLEFIRGSIFLQGIISSSDYRIGLSRISFIVDTGSPTTFISEKDALALQIPFRALRFKEHMKLGGAKYELLSGKKVKLYFKTDEPKSISFDFNLTIAKTTKTTQEGIQEARSCPSIIGTDFLIQNKLGLVFWPSKEIFHLEKED